MTECDLEVTGKTRFDSMKKGLFVLCFALLFASCGRQLTSLPTIEPQLVKSADVLADSIYFSEITAMKYHGDRIYACCMGQSQILCMDDEFGLLHTIGHEGRAANELMDPSSFDIEGDTIAVLCYGSFKRYTVNGEFVGTFDIGRLLPNKDFAMCAGSYYYTSSNQGPVISLSADGTSRSFGERYRFETEEAARYRNARFTRVYRDRIITVSDNLPYIEVFDRQTLESVRKVDYSDVDLVSEIMKSNASEQLAANQYRTLVSGCNVADGKLYVLLADNLDGFCANKIIVFDLERDCRPVSIVQLPGARYFSFCVNGQTLYAFNLLENTLEKMTL